MSILKKYYKIKVSENFLNEILCNAEVNDDETGGDSLDYIRKVLRSNGIHTKYDSMYGTRITKINTKFERHLSLSDD